jgi:putative restriction endonuclease
VWLEMSRDEAHGGDGWGFGECIWSPHLGRSGREWAYWNLILAAKEGDTVFHLRGAGRSAAFVGYSIVDSGGHVTSRRPTDPGEWGYSKEFHRAGLRDFTPLSEPILLSDFWVRNNDFLRNFYEENRKREERVKIFFVVQGGRLQCLNGAYFSALPPELTRCLLDTAEVPATPEDSRSVRRAVIVREQVRTIRARIGQEIFSRDVRKNYRSRCCFPDCTISDESLLVASHIARWADVPALRGDLGNGLCLCLMHDRAFEMGLFTLSEHGAIKVNQMRASLVRWAAHNLLTFDGRQVSKAEVAPSAEALKYHWERISFLP